MIDRTRKLAEPGSAGSGSGLGCQTLDDDPQTLENLEEKGALHTHTGRAHLTHRLWPGDFGSTSVLH